MKEKEGRRLTTQLLVCSDWRLTWGGGGWGGWGGWRGGVCVHHFKGQDNKIKRKWQSWFVNLKNHIIFFHPKAAPVLKCTQTYQCLQHKLNLFLISLLSITIININMQDTFTLFLFFFWCFLYIIKWFQRFFVCLNENNFLKVNTTIYIYVYTHMHEHTHTHTHTTKISTLCLYNLAIG